MWRPCQPTSYGIYLSITFPVWRTMMRGAVLPEDDSLIGFESFDRKMMIRCKIQNHLPDKISNTIYIWNVCLSFHIWYDDLQFLFASPSSNFQSHLQSQAFEHVRPGANSNAKWVICGVDFTSQHIICIYIYSYKQFIIRHGRASYYYQRLNPFRSITLKYVLLCLKRKR